MNLKNLKKVSLLLSSSPMDSGTLVPFAQALFVTVLIFSTVLFSTQAYAAAVTLSVTVQTSLTFTATTNAADQFPNLTPGTFVFATTTLSTLTNDSSGWVVSLSGDNKSGAQNNLLSGANSIPDQTEWVPGAATTTAANAAIRTALINAGNVLAFRVMTASSTNGTPFLASTWWGASDVDGTAKFAGIASSTVPRTIGNAGTGSYSAAAHLNTVQYYLNVGPSQPTGTYSAPLTFTATGN